MCKNVINAFNVVHSTVQPSYSIGASEDVTKRMIENLVRQDAVQLAFFVDKSLTCKKQISPLIRFLKVQVLDYWECTFLLLFADYAISKCTNIFYKCTFNIGNRYSKLTHWEQKSKCRDHAFLYTIEEKPLNPTI